jgi:hypothetical protein
VNTPELDLILDECLEQVLSGERTIADCLTQYPAYADELKPVLQVAVLTSRLKRPQMDAAAVQALEMRLRGARLAQQRPARRAFLAPLGRLAAMLGLVFLLTLGAGGGAVAASASSLPGDPLYGLKRWWESVVLAVAALIDGWQDDVWLHLAQTRLDEAEALAARGLMNRDILLDVYTAAEQTIALADAATAPQIAAFLADAGTRLQNLPTTAATEPVRAQLLTLVLSDHGPRLPLLVISPAPPTPTATGTFTETATLRPTLTPLASWTPTPLESPTLTPSATPTLPPTFTPTSRVPATATRTPEASDTPTALPTASPTPTATWTPLPLPELPPTDWNPPPTARPGTQSSATPVPPTVEATIRYRDTQAAVYATQTAQALVATEEARP